MVRSWTHLYQWRWDGKEGTRKKNKCNKGSTHILTLCPLLMVFAILKIWPIFPFSWIMTAKSIQESKQLRRGEKKPKLPTVLSIWLGFGKRRDRDKRGGHWELGLGWWPGWARGWGSGLQHSYNSILFFGKGGNSRLYWYAVRGRKERTNSLFSAQLEMVTHSV